MKLAAIITLGVASALLASAIAMAEHWRLGTWEIPSWQFFGTPFAAVFLAILALLAIRRQQSGDSGVATEAGIGVALVVLVAACSMVFLRDRYQGDYNPFGGRLAPDGSKVTNVSWKEEDGHFIETINGHFEVELTQSQYREVMRKHQAPFLAGIVAIATIPVSLALVSLIVSRRRKARVAQLNR
jgi:peptidoglycan/LPS O-acetylase OafA/YrhL